MNKGKGTVLPSSAAKPFFRKGLNFSRRVLLTTCAANDHTTLVAGVRILHRPLGLRRRPEIFVRGC